jgi:hypothetical protein
MYSSVCRFLHSVYVIRMHPVIFFKFMYSSASRCFYSVYVFQYIQLSSFCVCIPVHPVVFILYMYSSTPSCLQSVYVFQYVRLSSYCICIPVYAVFFILCVIRVHLVIFFKFMYSRASKFLHPYIYCSASGCLYSVSVLPYSRLSSICVRVVARTWVFKVPISRIILIYIMRFLSLFLSAFCHVTTRLSKIYSCAASLSVLLA